MPRYLTSAIFTDAADMMSTIIASRREPWYEASSSIMIGSVHRVDQVRRWSSRTSSRDRHELILCVQWLFPSRSVMEPSRTLAGVINTTRPGHDRMASRMLSSGCLRQLESDSRRPERRFCSLQGPSLWEVGIEPMATPEGQEPISGKPGGQDERNRDHTHGVRENRNGLGVNHRVAENCKSN